MQHGSWVSILRRNLILHNINTYATLALKSLYCVYFVGMSMKCGHIHTRARTRTHAHTHTYKTACDIIHYLSRSHWKAKKISTKWPCCYVAPVINITELLGRLDSVPPVYTQNLFFKKSVTKLKKLYHQTYIHVLKLWTICHFIHQNHTESNQVKQKWRWNYTLFLEHYAITY
jgi:hypothetical protein